MYIIFTQKNVNCWTMFTYCRLLCHALVPLTSCTNPATLHVADNTLFHTRYYIEEPEVSD